jgi:hypothetical protein
LDRIEHHPELLGLLADSYAEAHPSAPDLVAVQVIQRHFTLAHGRQTGDYSDRIVVDFDLEDGA